MSESASQTRGEQIRPQSSRARRRPIFTCVALAWSVAFVVGQCIACVLLLPWTLSFDRDRRAAAGLASWCMRHSLRVPRDWRPAVDSLRSLDHLRPAVIVINHASIVDVILAAGIPGAPRILTKPWVARIPLLRFGLWATGHEVLDPTDAASVRESMDRLAGLLERGISVVIFPEGTRRDPDLDPPLGPFDGGAFWLASRASVPVIPVLLYGTGHLIPRGTLWMYSHRIASEVLPPVEPSRDRRAFSAEVWAAMNARIIARRARADALSLSPESADA